jgi:penicillin-binding protein 1C
MFDLIGLLPFSHWFDKPEHKPRHIRVCKHSGHRAGKYCTETRSIQAFESTTEGPVCPYCHPVHLSLDGRYRIIDRSEPTITKNVFTLPPSMEHYYKKIHPEYVSLPAVKANPHQANFQESPMKILYPSKGSIIKIPRQLDGNNGRITCSVAHSNPSMEVFWHCDGSYLGATQDIHSMTLDLSTGNHTISIVDTEGLTASTNFIVVD